MTKEELDELEALQNECVRLAQVPGAENHVSHFLAWECAYDHRNGAISACFPRLIAAARRALELEAKVDQLRAEITQELTDVWQTKRPTDDKSLWWVLEKGGNMYIVEVEFNEYRGVFEYLNEAADYTLKEEDMDGALWCPVQIPVLPEEYEEGEA